MGADVLVKNQVGDNHFFAQIQTLGAGNMAEH